MKLTFAQFLAPWVGVVVGKFNSLEGDNNDFAHDYRTQFSNMGFNFNLTAALARGLGVGWGPGLSAVERRDDHGGSRRPGRKPPPTIASTTSSSSGVMVTSEARFTIKPFGLLGHQLVGFLWSQQESRTAPAGPRQYRRPPGRQPLPRLADPGPILGRIINRFFPDLAVSPEPLKTQEDTWAVYYSFDQFVWSPAGDPTRGIGIFFPRGRL